MKWFLIVLWTMQPAAGPFDSWRECTQMRAAYAKDSKPLSMAQTKCELRDEKNWGRR